MNIRQSMEKADKITDALFAELARCGWTAYKIAKNCALTEAELSYIKNKKRQVRLCTFLEIANACGVSLADIIRKVEHDSGNVDEYEMEKTK